MKKVTTLIRLSPYQSNLASETLRMSVGLILSDNKVQVILLDDGVFALCPARPEIIRAPDVGKHLGALKEFGCTIVADKESLTARGLSEVQPLAAIVDRAAIAALLAESDYVIGP